MNTNNAKAKLQVLVKFAAIAILAILTVSCEKPAPPPKVLQKIEGSFERMSSLVIRHIDNDGFVLLGKTNMNMWECQSAAGQLRFPKYRLEGKAFINDPVVLTCYFENQLLENGLIQSVVKKWTVTSLRNPEYEKKFSALKD
jgi:hypothetical protein